MKVRDLITALKAMPMDAEVAHVWDGEPRTHINVVWLTPDGRVLTADYGELVYDQRNWPEDLGGGWNSIGLLSCRTPHVR